MSRNVNGLNSNSLLGIIGQQSTSESKMVFNIDNATINGVDDVLDTINTTLDNHEISIDANTSSISNLETTVNGLSNYDDTNLQNQITNNRNDIDEIKDGDLEELSLTKSNFHSELNLRGSSGNYTGIIHFQNWNSSNNDIKSILYH